MTEHAPARRLSLNLFIHPAGHHEAAWRHPDTQPERIFTADFYTELARTAEAARFDAVFFADGPVLHDGVEFNSVGRLEPILTLASIAAATTRIGLIATASTTFYDPYNLARLFSTLDHLSNGRAGWNIVTTASEDAARNFGLDSHPDHVERYARAAEFVEVTTRLWDSWEDDAVLIDRASGRYADPAKIHDAAFRGEHLRVEGAFNAARSPQGHPVLVQAGASNEGRAFASRYAEAIFTAHQRLADAQAFYADIKAGAEALGRSRDAVKILPGISPFIASTEDEARALEREQPTVRGLLHRLAGARGHRVVAGTPEQVADTIEEWFTQGAADGFNVMPPYLPGGLDDFADHVVPILRERGLFRTEYEGTTLRDHLGLARPESRYATRAADVLPEASGADEASGAVGQEGARTTEPVLA